MKNFIGMLGGCASSGDIKPRNTATASETFVKIELADHFGQQQQKENYGKAGLRLGNRSTQKRESSSSGRLEWEGHVFVAATSRTGEIRMVQGATPKGASRRERRTDRGAWINPNAHSGQEGSDRLARKPDRRARRGLGFSLLGLTTSHRLPGSIPEQAISCADREGNGKSLATKRDRRQAAAKIENWGNDAQASTKRMVNADHGQCVTAGETASILARPVNAGNPVSYSGKETGWARLLRRWNQSIPRSISAVARITTSHPGLMNSVRETWATATNFPFNRP